MATVRRARITDTPAMGRLHVRAWQVAYRGLMPDEYLDGLSSEERERMWSEALSRTDASRTVLVVEDDDRVVGFAAVGPSSEAGLTGELYSINVDPDSWGRGHGRALLVAAETALATLGYREAQLWVLPDNQRARHFYEAAGWAPDGVERTTEVLGVVVQEIRYHRTLSPVEPESGNWS
jgi:ribosomal protein S18 acetylase RimI-like enzyme